MNETILHFIDKSNYLPGPWKDEPDKVVWKDPETNLDCMIRRNSIGVWCGYVGVPEEHPAYGKHYHEFEFNDDKCENTEIDYAQKKINDIEVHGGLTFAGPCSEDEKETGICHKSDKEVYWFGFDCGHVYDYMPGMGADVLALDDISEQTKNLFETMRNRKDFETYRDMDYAKAEVKSLAKQLSEIKL